MEWYIEGLQPNGTWRIISTAWPTMAMAEAWVKTWGARNEAYIRRNFKEIRVASRVL